MYNRVCGNEVIKGCIDDLKGLVFDLIRGESSEENFNTVVAINEELKILEDTVAEIEIECDRQKMIASKLRKLHGEAFSAECDAAGIK